MSIFNTKPDLNRLFPFAKKKPNIPTKLLDKVDTKINKQKSIEDKICIKTLESIRCDVLTDNNEKSKFNQEKTCINDNSKKNILETNKTISTQIDDSEINAKKKKLITRKLSNVSEVSIEEIKKPKENYQRWNIPFSSKFKGKDFDKTLLTMQDLIYYNPVTNPIIKVPKVKLKTDDDPDGDLLPIDQDQIPSSSNNCITPCIKVGADGKIIIDQETLTLNETGLEEKREELAKAKVIEESAFHSQSYSYKRKKEPSKQWTKYETLRFYKCLMNLGTDFSMIGQYFPCRTRAQIKRKYKTEEKKNPHLINGALTNATHYNGVLIENMFQEDEDEPNEEIIETNVLVKSEVGRRRHKNIVRSDCAKISLCGFMMEEEVVLKNKRKYQSNSTTASSVRGEVEALKTIRVKTVSKKKKLIKVNELKDEHVPKVRKLQDFHEEYNKIITKYENDSNSE